MEGNYIYNLTFYPKKYDIWGKKKLSYLGYVKFCLQYQHIINGLNIRLLSKIIHLMRDQQKSKVIFQIVCEFRKNHDPRQVKINMQIVEVWERIPVNVEDNGWRNCQKS